MLKFKHIDWLKMVMWLFPASGNTQISG